MLQRAILTWRPYEHKRPRGRPPIKWTDNVKLTVDLRGLQVATNRYNWKRLEEAYMHKDASEEEKDDVLYYCCHMIFTHFIYLVIHFTFPSLYRTYF